MDGIVNWVGQVSSQICRRGKSCTSEAFTGQLQSIEAVGGATLGSVSNNPETMMLTERNAGVDEITTARVV